MEIVLVMRVGDNGGGCGIRQRASREAPNSVLVSLCQTHAATGGRELCAVHRHSDAFRAQAQDGFREPFARLRSDLQRERRYARLRVWKEAEDGGNWRPGTRPPMVE